MYVQIIFFLNFVWYKLYRKYSHVTPMKLSETAIVLVGRNFERTPGMNWAKRVDVAFCNWRNNEGGHIGVKWSLANVNNSLFCPLTIIKQIVGYFASFEMFRQKPTWLRKKTSRKIISMEWICSSRKKINQLLQFIVEKFS